MLTAQVPQGSDQIVPPVLEGTEYGRVTCHGAKLGRGAAFDRFKVPGSGNVIGSYTEYFRGGSIRGKLKLLPEEAPPPTSRTTLAASWRGKMTVTGGTGAYAGAKGRGTAKCSTLDGIHKKCEMRLRLSRL